MKKFAINTLFLIAVLISAARLSAQTVSKIILNPGWVTQENGTGCACHLVDEQVLAGDPLHGQGGLIENKPESEENTWEWSPVNGVENPVYAYIDLKRVYVVTNIYLRDVNSNGEMSVYKGTPGKWKYLFNDFCYGYNSWNAHTLSGDTTRYLRIKLHKAGAKIAEVVVYGYDPDPENSDSIAPSSVSNLAIDSVSTSSVFLSWNAPGDDGNSGTATSYELRYSNAPVTSANFFGLSSADSVSIPLSAGTKTSFVVRNLNPGTPYYFSLIARDEMQNSSALSNMVQAHTKYKLNVAPYRIILENDMIVNESALGNTSLLNDEQDIVVDSTRENIIKCKTVWNSPASSQFYPLYLMIDLGAMYHVNQLCIYNERSPYHAISPIELYSGEPGNWVYKGSDSIKRVSAWTIDTINTITRYLRLKLTNSSTRISELALFGYPVSYPVEQTLVETVPPKPLMEDFIGVNTLYNEPLGKVNCVGFAREYHNWNWNDGEVAYPNNEIEWDDPWSGFNFDKYYENLFNYGLKGVACIQGNVLWASDYDWSKGGSKPVSATEDPELPASYTEHASFMYQMVARYGNQTVPDDKLLLKSNQERFSGKGWLHYYEDWNEQDKDWEGRSARFTPFEYAAMASADYDGHQKTLGAYRGVKNADPNAKMAMGGLAGISLDYIKAMNSWFRRNRTDSVIPLDVLNMHHYSVGTVGGISCGISPEQDDLKGKMEQIVKYRNTNMPGKEVWLSEFGYDTHPNSPIKAPAIGSCSQYETQARWIIRSYLALAAAGVDKAMLFSLADVDSTSAIQYSTCGLTSTASSGFRPKTAWYYVYTMKNRLRGYRFESEVASNHEQVKIYKFKNDSSGHVAYALWSPTASDNSVSQFTFSLNSPANVAKLVTLRDSTVYGSETALSMNGNQVTLDVCEKPVFVITSLTDSFPAMPQLPVRIMLDSSMIVNEKNLGKAYLLADEQNLCGDPINGVYGNPRTEWVVSYKASDFPASAYIDLGREREISNIYVFDSNSEGLFTISTGTPGNWTPLFTENLNTYLWWRGKAVNIKTRYIRLTKFNSANITEIVLYGK